MRGRSWCSPIPQVGNYGVNADDAQAEHPPCRRSWCATCAPRPPAAQQESLGEYLAREGVVASRAVDTRALVRHIRDHGAQRAVVSTEDTDVAALLAKVRQSPSLVGENQVVGVSCDGAYSYTAANLPVSHSFALSAPVEPRFKVIVYHCGVKRSILDGLGGLGLRAYGGALGHPGEEVLAMNPDGVFLSNGPGDRRRWGRPTDRRRSCWGRCRCSASASGTR